MTSLSLDVADILDIGKWSVYETVSSLSLPFSLSAWAYSVAARWMWASDLQCIILYAKSC